jgi:hypothetical protein
MINFFDGKVDFSKSFWVYFICGNLFFKFLIIMVATNVDEPKHNVILMTVLLIKIFWFIFSAIGTWRSSNYFKEVYGRWATAAKVFIPLSILLLW